MFWPHHQSVTEHQHPRDHQRVSNQRYVQVSWLWEEIRAPRPNHNDNKEHPCYKEGGTRWTTAPQIMLPGLRPINQIESECIRGSLVYITFCPCRGQTVLLPAQRPFTTAWTVIVMTSLHLHWLNAGALTLIWWLGFGPRLANWMGLTGSEHTAASLSHCWRFLEIWAADVPPFLPALQRLVFMVSVHHHFT